jgi:hypothetical protein
VQLHPKETGAIQLAAAIRIARDGVVGVIGPLVLDLPLCAVREGDQRHIERPGALVAILLAGRVPGDML